MNQSRLIFLFVVLLIALMPLTMAQVPISYASEYQSTSTVEGHAISQWAEANSKSSTNDQHQTNPFLIVGRELHQANLAEQLPWWDKKWEYRVPIVVNAAGFERSDKPLQVDLDFGAFFSDLGASGSVDLDSLRLLETNEAGAVLADDVPFQYEPVSATKGTLVLLLTGKTQAAATRYYHLYFDSDSSDLPAAPVVAPRVKAKDNDKDTGAGLTNDVIKFETQSGVYFYDKIGGGFSSLDDVDGRDWISYCNVMPDCDGSAGDFRGIPNLVPPADGGFFHPGRTGVSTNLVTQGPLRATMVSTTSNKAWSVRWDVYPDYATMTVEKVPAETGFWFLYEGTPGGVLETGKDFVVRAPGTPDKSSLASVTWEEELEDEEWAFFADPGVDRSLFLVHHDNDKAIDSYRPMEESMTVFGFGRKLKQLSGQMFGARQQFTFGLVDGTATGSTRNAIRSAYKPLDLQRGSPERRPYSLTIVIDGAGEVTGKPAKSEYLYGDEVTLTATADPGWRFAEWQGDLAGTNAQETVTILQDTEVTAVFSQNEYELTVIKRGGGTVTITPEKATYNYGEKVDLKAVPATGWRFVTWDGDLESTDDEVTVTITGNTRVFANFERSSYSYLVPVVLGK